MTTNYWAVIYGKGDVQPVGMYISQPAKLHELCESLPALWGYCLHAPSGKIITSWANNA